MEKFDLEHFKKLLMQEKRRVRDLMNLLERNEVINSNEEMAQELSFYDNHPSDSATELNDKEKGLAFKGNEMNIMNKIDRSLDNMEQGKYGTCQRCGVEIPRERLEFIPYTEYCVNCQKEINDAKPPEKKDRSVEESVLGIPFGYGYNDFKDQIGYDAEDSYQDVEKFNRLENVEEYYSDDEETTDPMDKISNAQYKAQLPD